MNLRKLDGQRTFTIIFIAAAIISAAQSALAGEVVLQDSKVLVAFDSTTGALTRLEDKSTHWKIERRPELGLSFRLLAPVPGHRNNFVFGEKQHSAQVEKVSDHEVHLQWKNLVSQHAGVLPITFSATVTLDNGNLTFQGNLVNDSSVVVETIQYPYLGDLSASSFESTLEVKHMWYDNLESASLYPEFRNQSGYWGVRYPRQTIDSKRSLFCLIQGQHAGLYVGMHDSSVPYLLQFTFEQHPALVQSVSPLVPKKNSISGLPVHLNFGAIHFVFVQPHSATHLAPVVIVPYSGDWHAGVHIYKQWRATWFKQPYLPSWVQDVHSWLQLQENGAEEDFSIPYHELDTYIDECAKAGVQAIQLVGWNKGGQDRGDPSQDTDPGLGTWQELHDAIAHARSVGVKMILFGKLNWADLTTEWYKNELYKYAATDPYGIEYQTNGYSYDTPTQLAGINNRRRAIMDVDSPGYRDLATKEFRKILALNADGWLFDEVCHHGPVEYSFSPDHGYKAPGYIYAGDMPFARQMRDAADAVNRDFIFAGEGPQDWLMQYYPVSYFRIQGNSVPVARYIDPFAPLIVAVTGVDDREKLNLILMDRYIISYEPYNFKGHITDFPLTLAYGQKIDALRRKYKDYLWDADFRDTLGASVTANAPVRYSVFINKRGKRAVVVVNMSATKPLEAKVDLPDHGKLVAASPENPNAQPYSGAIAVPARSAIVVMEE